MPPEDATAEEALRGDEPFIMQADGKGWLFVPSGPDRRAAADALRAARVAVRATRSTAQQRNPARQTFERPDNRTTRPHGRLASFPFVLTTYRLTEHHTAGGMSRWLPWLAELQPEVFCEVSPELAAERGLEHGGWATIVTARAAIEARVLVTERLRR